MFKILLAFQILSILGVSSIIYKLAKTYNIKLNWYNLPTILLHLIALIGTALLCLYHFIWYLSIGFFFGTVLFIINSLEIPNLESVSNENKVAASIATLLWWPEIITIILFYTLNLNIIDE